MSLEASPPLQVSGRVREGQVLILLLKFGRICLWRCLVSDFCVLGGFDYQYNFVSGNLFVEIFCFFLVSCLKMIYVSVNLSDCRGALAQPKDWSRVELNFSDKWTDPLCSLLQSSRASVLWIFYSWRHPVAPRDHTVGFDRMWHLGPSHCLMTLLYNARGFLSQLPFHRFSFLPSTLTNAKHFLSSNLYLHSQLLTCLILSRHKRSDWTKTPWLSP